MHTLAFRSPDPLDHVCRALDAIRKMGFHLASLRVDSEADGGFRISIAIDVHELLTVGTLRERVSSCIGVYDLTCDIECEAVRS
ncbi:hypothetical protein [Hyphomicrobium sp. CS1BSMeth3]|uniref:hypothetical protein n=1 Tax=Hyphomicrobium sp. CS1BSMeth3 TaxID=1892844 RepID=UPI00092FFEC4|nr:hypothetical protein [Hyphomicrobium sp. CS1BSMeth3]